MKSFKLAFRLFYKNTVLHSLLIFQMILVFAIGASVVSEVNAIYYTKNIIRNLGNTNYAFFQTINERDLIAGSNDTNTFNTYNEFNLNIIKDKLNGKSDFITEYSLFGKNQTNNELFHLNAFDDVLLKNITIQMTNGNWFTNTDKKDGLVRFVTDCKAYNIGDIIPITIEDDTNQIKINLWVIGIAKTPFYTPTTSSTATKPDATTIVCECEPSDAGNYISGIICNKDIQTELTAAVKYDFNYHIFFEDSLTESELKENIETLELYGTVSTGREIIQETNKNIYQSLKQRLPDIIFISLISLVGFCGISLINISSNIPIFALYSILGCSKNKLNSILFFYVLIIEFSALTPTILLLIFAKISEHITPYIPFVNSGTYIIIISLALLFFFISYSFVIISFKKQSTKQLL